MHTQRFPTAITHIATGNRHTQHKWALSTIYAHQQAYNLLICPEVVKPRVCHTYSRKHAQNPYKWALSTIYAHRRRFLVYNTQETDIYAQKWSNSTKTTTNQGFDLQNYQNQGFEGDLEFLQNENHTIRNSIVKNHNFA